MHNPRPFSSNIYKKTNRSDVGERNVEFHLRPTSIHISDRSQKETGDLTTKLKIVPTRPHSALSCSSQTGARYQHQSKGRIIKGENNPSSSTKSHQTRAQQSTPIIDEDEAVLKIRAVMVSLANPENHPNTNDRTIPAHHDASSQPKDTVIITKRDLLAKRNDKSQRPHHGGLSPGKMKS